MKRKIKIVVKNILMLSAFSLLTPVGFAAGFEVEVERAVDSATQRIIAQENRARELGIGSVDTEWSRCDVKHKRRGRNRISSQENCKTVTTTCGAIITDGRAFISADCYKLNLKNNQTAEVNFSVLTTLEGKKIFLTDEHQEIIKEFIMWFLNN